MTQKPLYETSSILRYLNTSGRDLFAKTVEYAELSGSVRRDGIWAFRTVVRERNGSRCVVETDSGEIHDVIDAASNDYLRLSQEPGVKEQVCEAVARFGVGASGASMLNGQTTIHRDLESELAAFIGKDAVELCASGYAMMAGAMCGLLRPTDAVFYDQYIHQSLLDGIRLSGAARYRFPHNDVDALQQLLETHREKGRGALIVVDGVYSLNSSIAPVEAISTLAQRYGCRLFVDDAHGVGTVNDGYGVCRGVEVDVIGGVLSKALGAAGGFVAGSHEVIDYLRFFGRFNCASTNLSVADAAAALSALRILRQEPERVHALHDRVRSLRTRLQELEIHTEDSIAPVVFVPCGSDAATYRGWRRLLDAGVLGHALPFPIAPFGKAGVRLRVNTDYSEADMEHVAQAAAQIQEAKQCPAATPAVQTARPGLSPLGYESVTLPSPMGSLEALVRDGRPPYRLFLPAVLCDGDMYEAVLREYDGPHGVIVINPWGHGESAPAPHDITLEAMAQELDTILSKWFPADVPYRLVGTSLGAMLIVRMRASGSAQAQGLMLIGGSVDPEEGPARAMFQSLTEVASALGAESVAEDVLEAYLSPNFRYARPLATELLRRRLIGSRIDEVLPVVHAVLDRGGCDHLLRRIHCPTTILVGDEDLAEPVSHSEKMAELLTVSELYVAPHCGHLLPVEAPQAVLRVLRHWDAEDAAPEGPARAPRHRLGRTISRSGETLACPPKSGNAGTVGE